MRTDANTRAAADRGGLFTAARGGQPAPVDLHTHSTFSDGQYTPSQLALLARQRGLGLLALTDHDTLAGIPEARAACASLGVRFTAGIEMSTRVGVELHILGLGIDENAPALCEACRAYRLERLARAERICRYLKKNGVNVTMDEVLARAAGAAPARPHFARLMLEKGYVRSLSEAFSRYLETPGFHRETDGPMPQPEEAVDAIHRGGGKAVLAHPGLLRLGRAKQAALIRQLASDGLDGVEVFYTGHDYMHMKFYRRLCAEYGLLATAGSDFHGEKVRPRSRLGVTVPAERAAGLRLYVPEDCDTNERNDP